MLRDAQPLPPQAPSLHPAADTPLTPRAPHLSPPAPTRQAPATAGQLHLRLRRLTANPKAPSAGTRLCGLSSRLGVRTGERPTRAPSFLSSLHLQTPALPAAGFLQATHPAATPGHRLLSFPSYPRPARRGSSVHPAPRRGTDLPTKRPGPCSAPARIPADSRRTSHACPPPSPWSVLTVDDRTLLPASCSLKNSTLGP